jgi:hypothetical protein
VEAAHPSEHKNKSLHYKGGKIPKFDNFINKGRENLKNIKMLHKKYLYVISGFRRGVDEAFTLLGCYAALNGRQLRTLNDRQVVPKHRYLSINVT